MDKEDHGVGTNCIARCIADDSCYNYEICYTPTGINLIDVNID